jgi:hypothetical protein
MGFALVALIGLMALAIDVGQVLIVKEQLQRASDASALAAATSHDDISSRALAFYTHNALPGVADTPTLQGGNIYTIRNDTITITTPYSDAQTQAAGYAAADCIEVVATRRVSSVFGPLSGAAQRTVRARAVAWRHLVAGTLPAIFGHRQGASPAGFDWSGSGGEVRGDIVTNGAVRFTGSNHICHGDVLYGYGYTITGSGNYADHWIHLPSVRDWPLTPPSIGPDDFGPFDYVINGNYSLSGSNKTIPPGVYSVNGDVSISGSGHIANGVTFVATGKISVSASGGTFTAARLGTLFYSSSTSSVSAINVSGSGTTYRGSMFADGKISLSGSGTTVTTDRTDLLLYSRLSTSSYALDVSGSGGSFNGTCFAPNGGIDYSGSSNHIMNGSLIADHVDSSGSGFTVIPLTNGGATHLAGKLIE